MKPFFSEGFRGLSPLALKDVLWRLAVVAVLALSLGLVWWSWGRLQPLRQKINESNRQIGKLTDDIQKMEINWKTNELEEVTLQYRQTQDLLFADPQTFTLWLDQLKAQILPLGLEVNVAFGQAQALTNNNHQLAVVPASVEVRPLTAVDYTSSPYHRLLEFCQYVTTQTQRVDLIHLNVEGNSNSVNKADLTLHLWAKAETRRR